MENYAETRVQLNQVLDLERALARQRRQQQWRQFMQEGKRLRALLLFCLLHV